MSSVIEDYIITRIIQKQLFLLKVETKILCRILNENSVQTEILTQNIADIDLVEDLSIPYLNFYYDDEDPDGNKVNTYYGYICCPYNKEIAEKVVFINLLKDEIAEEIKKLRALFKFNTPLFSKTISTIDPTGGRVNIKELTRRIVLIESDNSPIKKVSFQPEIINKGKGRCLTASEIKHVIENYFDGSEGKYSNDLLLLDKLESNELLSPIGAERKKCRVNVRSELETFKGRYCSIPIIILSKPANNFKTNLNTIFEKQFKKVRIDQQLEKKPYLAFRSFTRKQKGYKEFLTNEELEKRKEYLISAFI